MSEKTATTTIGASFIASSKPSHPILSASSRASPFQSLSASPSLPNLVSLSVSASTSPSASLLVKPPLVAPTATLGCSPAVSTTPAISATTSVSSPGVAPISTNSAAKMAASTFLPQSQPFRPSASSHFSMTPLHGYFDRDVPRLVGTPFAPT